MLKIPHYKSPESLTGPLSNNAFDYAIRSENHPEPNLRIANLQIFTQANEALKHLKISAQPAFETIDEEKLKSFAGLESFLLFPSPLQKTTPVFIFDNHNHAFYFWHIAQEQLALFTPLTLIHIDQHKDTRIPAHMLAPEQARDPNELYRFTNEILNVGNFIPPAIKTGLIDTIINIDSSTTVEKYLRTRAPLRYILDIDLDFFAPDLDYISNAQKLDLIKKLLPQAAIVTIATSPFFLNQTLAITLIKKLFAD